MQRTTPLSDNSNQSSLDFTLREWSGTEKVDQIELHSIFSDIDAYFPPPSLISRGIISLSDAQSRRIDHENSGKQSNASAVSV